MKVGLLIIKKKKNNLDFDVTMGSFDGAETSELVGLNLLSKVSKIIYNAHLGLYRDDGLALITNCNGRKLDRIRKKLHQIFKDKGLKITVELCDNNLDFLDISLNVSDKSHRPYKKPNVDTQESRLKYTINWQIQTKWQSYKPGART